MIFDSSLCEQSTSEEAVVGKSPIQNQSKPRNSIFSVSNHAFAAMRRTPNLRAFESSLTPLTIWKDNRWTGRKGRQGKLFQKRSTWTIRFSSAQREQLGFLAWQKKHVAKTAEKIYEIFFWNMASFRLRAWSKKLKEPLQIRQFSKSNTLHKNCLLQEKRQLHCENFEIPKTFTLLLNKLLQKI